MTIGTSDGLTYESSVHHILNIPMGTGIQEDERKTREDKINYENEYLRLKKENIPPQDKKNEHTPTSPNAVIADASGNIVPPIITDAVGDKPIPRITVTPKQNVEELQPLLDLSDSTDVNVAKMGDALLGRNQERYKLFPEKILDTLIDAFKLPKDVIQGGEDPMTPRNIGRAFELASAGIFGPGPIAAKVVDGTLGVMAGVGSKTANKIDNTLANAMESRGFSHDQIYNATGWYRGLDNKWKYEIPDTGMKAKANLIKPGDYKLDQVIDHPELFKAYPDLKDLKIKVVESIPFGDSGAPRLGMFDHNTQTLTIAATDVSKMKQTIIHEIQHAIQNREGFARGTNLDYEADKLLNLVLNKMSENISPEKNNLLGDFAKRLLLNDHKDYNNPAIHSYLRNFGEYEAEVVRNRLKRGATVPPYKEDLYPGLPPMQIGQ